MQQTAGHESGQLGGLDGDPTRRAECIHAPFLRAAASHPERPAIRFSGGRLDYAQLDRVSAWLAIELLRRRTLEGSIVAVHATRSPLLVVAALACSRAGLSFALIDGAYPDTKICKLLSVLQPSLVVGAGIAELALKRSCANPSVPRWALDESELSRLATAREAPPALDTLIPQPGGVAYLLFTSGTTGTPRCIQTGHEPLLHFVAWYAREFGPQAGDRFSMVSGLAHDPILRDIFVPLSIGATLCIPDQTTISQPQTLFSWFKRERINFCHVTPQLLKILASRTAQSGLLQGNTLPHLRYIFSGGDELRISHVRAVRQTAPSARLVNFYGATETPQAMGFHVVDQDTDPIPAGRGIADVRLAIVNDRHESLPPGNKGEVCIFTRYLSLGYLGDEAGTHAKFIDTGDPNGERGYLTGDLGIEGPDGAIVISGRADHQVKIRGYRIEPGEVEKALENVAQVGESLVLALEDESSEKRLVAFVVPNSALRVAEGGIGLAVDELGETGRVREVVGKTLPSYMVPAQVIWLDKFPLTPNGKVDRSVLRQLATRRDSAGFAPRSGSRSGNELRDRLRSILGLPTLNGAYSFVDHGGDSLSFIQAATAIEKTLGFLPNSWEKMSLDHLCEIAPRSEGYFGSVSLTVFVRAISIVLVVAGHYPQLTVHGTTTTLLVLAGWSLAKYQLNRVVEHGSVAPLFKTVFYIWVPTELFNLFVMLKNSRHIDWSVLMMINTYRSAFFVNGGYWFLNVLIHSYLFLALLLSCSRVRSRLRRAPYRATLSATLLFGSIAAVGHLVQDGHPIHFPWQKIWLMFLGMAIAHATSRRDRVVLAVLCVMTAFDIWASPHATLFPVLACWLVLFVDRVKLPRFLASVVKLLASASLFIYLAEWQLAGLYKQLGLDPASHVYWMIALQVAGGLMVARLWDHIWNPALAYVRGLLQSFRDNAKADHNSIAS